MFAFVSVGQNPSVLTVLTVGEAGGNVVRQKRAAPGLEAARVVQKQTY
jgi:hypothetical protein